MKDFTLQSESSELAPIVLFAYKRPDELQQTISALQANYLASQSDLYVFVDGPKHPFDLPKVAAVCGIVEQIDGFRTIHRHYTERNRGLANSIIGGVSLVMAQHGRAIVVEDDLLTSPNFLDYMNQALIQYQARPDIFSISGYTFPFNRPSDYEADCYVYPRTGSWGWASWADRWQGVDWTLSDYDQFIADSVRSQAFNWNGSDRLRMLRRWKAGEIDSWAIRWCYAQAKVNGLTLYPTVSKVENIGFSPESTNTHGYNRYKTILDASTDQTFVMPDAIAYSDFYGQKMRRKFSLPVRAANRLLANAMLVQNWITHPSY